MHCYLLLAFLIGTTGGFFIQKKQAATCDGKQFATCLARFAKALNITEIPQNSTVFESYIQNILQTKGVAGFTDVCGTVSALEHCLGKQFSTCISVSFLESIGESQDDADAYTAMSRDYKYECGPGYNAIHKNFGCIMNTTSAPSFRQNFDACFKLFMIEIIKDPSGICKYLPEFAHCYSNPYTACSSSAAQAECNAIFARLQVGNEECKKADCKF